MWPSLRQVKNQTMVLKSPRGRGAFLGFGMLATYPVGLSTMKLWQPGVFHDARCLGLSWGLPTHHAPDCNDYMPQPCQPADSRTQSGGMSKVEASAASRRPMETLRSRGWITRRQRKSGFSATMLVLTRSAGMCRSAPT